MNDATERGEDCPVINAYCEHFAYLCDSNQEIAISYCKHPENDTDVEGNAVTALCPIAKVKGIRNRDFSYVEVSGDSCNGWINLFFGDDCVALIESKTIADRIKATTTDRRRNLPVHAGFLEIAPSDLSISTYSSTRKSNWGAFQDRGIQIIHLPTGIRVTSETGRSQHINRSIATSKLRGKLNEKT